MGLVGAGLIGPQHVEAVRRLGFVDVVAVAGSNEASAKAKAEAMGIPKAYDGYQALIDDRDVEVVHNCTPNNLHLPVNLAVIEKGKHVVSDKPLAMNGDEANQLLDAVTKAGVVHAVTFNYRGNPLVQQARAMIAAGEIGRVHFIHGHYLQDWLIKETDFSWRIEPEKSGPSSAMGDIGSHWCDLVQHVSGLRIESVLADLTTVIPTRKKPTVARETFSEATDDEGEDFAVEVEDLGSVLVRFENGCKGLFTAGQVCAGHKNDLVFEIDGLGGSLRWLQERQNELWIGRRDGGNVELAKDPGAMDASVAGYAHLPGGHQEGWATAFHNIMRDIYTHIADGKGPNDPHPPAFATFDDGYRANRIVDAILASSGAGGVWTDVRY
ncbi:MAG: dehydrogenase [Acidobacteria bacterium]|jgi:predicted dehydrogenase|nr:dehydrogenase [Acidobacteriota bacterium]